MNEHTIWSMMGAINQWWEFGDQGKIAEDQIPFWVSQLISTVTEQTGVTFDHETGKWSDDDSDDFSAFRTKRTSGPRTI